jgi:hypothetical protein|tara:strand:- start:747 stop:1607 length:861 start_codon:yes stop_codon:yes gene_type:complete
MIERIYIPTVRRADNQITFNNLPKELQERVVMVVEPGERHLYDYPCEYLEIPEKLVGTWTQLAETRLFIHKHAGAIKYCVADDDIKIRRRNAKYWTGQSNMEKSKRDATAEEMLDMYETVDKWFDERAIGVVGLSDAGTPPASNEYEDTKDVYSYVFYDGRMLSEVINDMDICSLRIAEDVLFLYEVLSRGINTRKSTEWMYDNRSMVQKDLSDTREVWTGMFKNVEDRPVNYYQSDAHYDAMRYIQSKYPHGVKIFEKDGKMKNRKYWKKVYNPKYENTLEDFMS